MVLTLPARHVSVSVPVEELSGVGEARRMAVKMAQALQFDESTCGRVALVVTEAATNILQHAKHGEVLLRPYSADAPACLEMLALDQGPGIANVAVAMRDGYTTAGSMGLGLGAMVRLSSFFEMTSTPGKGTAVLARIALAKTRHPPGQAFEWGVVCVPKRGEEFCGDAWAIAAARGRHAILMVDGLGHGPLAFDAAQQSLRTFAAKVAERPGEILHALHRALRETRGAVAGVAEITWDRRELRWAGAGNISGSLAPEEGKSVGLLSHSGTLGDNVTRFQEFVHPWPAHGLLVLHSDGLSSRWDLKPYPGLLRKDPSLIAGVLYRDFASRRDDVVVLICREPPKSPLERGEKAA